MDIVFLLPTPILLGSSEEHRAVLFVKSTLLKEGTIWDLLNWCFRCHSSPWYGGVSLKPPGASVSWAAVIQQWHFDSTAWKAMR